MLIFIGQIASRSRKVSLEEDGGTRMKPHSLAKLLVDQEFGESDRGDEGSRMQPSSLAKLLVDREFGESDGGDEGSGT